MPEPAPGVAEREYESLKTKRNSALMRARSCAELTLPSLVPPEGHNQTQTFVQPYQSLGARCVNHFASRLLITLFAPNQRGFRLQIPPDKKAKMPTEQAPEYEKGLAAAEQLIQEEIEGMRFRPALYYALRLLLISGNAVVYNPKGGRPKVYALPNFVCQRDGSGNLIQLITTEAVDRKNLPAEIEKVIAADVTKRDKRDVTIYTHVMRESPTKWVQYQEVCGIEIPESRGTFSDDGTPWLALRWGRIDGEDYGRGLVEEYFGDLKSVEGLSKALLLAALATAKVLFLVDPGGVTKSKDVERASLSVVPGRAQDVGVLRVDKMGDFNVSKSVLDDTVQRLAFAFLLNSAIQRQGERVTAEEIRYMANELENAHGGVYALLAEELQLYFVNLAMERLRAKGALPSALNSNNVRPLILTGLDALGRAADVARMDQLLAGAAELVGPANLEKYVDWGEYLTRRAIGLGVDGANLIRTREQIEAIETTAQQQQMLQTATGPAAQVAARALTEQQTQ